MRSRCVGGGGRRVSAAGGVISGMVALFCISPAVHADELSQLALTVNAHNTLGAAGDYRVLLEEGQFDPISGTLVAEVGWSRLSGGFRSRGLRRLRRCDIGGLRPGAARSTVPRMAQANDDEGQRDQFDPLAPARQSCGPDLGDG